MTIPARHIAVTLGFAVLSIAPKARAADADDNESKPPKAAPPLPVVAKEQEVPITDTREDPNRRYYFLGLRYRGTVVPQFLMNLFVDEGTTVYSNTIGAELDMRKQGQSTIPWIVYTDYNMGDTLFHQKGQPTIDSNYTVVNSSLKALYLGLDQLWSVPLDESHHWDFEFGFGVGLGVLFGDLQNDWVYQDPNGPLVASTGVHYSECGPFDPGVASRPSCHSDNHQGNPMPPKVGPYHEPFWFSGGSVPNIFPYISFPQLGVRYKPIKQMEARLGVGFSLTGFWFGLSADYGLETPEKSPKASSSLARLHDML
ncbi:MAG TPA: hypothetical protein VN894_21630 [Polyangiaceae bacterium]|nr:hypothetical protein [Polyangiaceae bacterium]